ncbi:hypothetical protein BLNAU_6269 [Blattamonas nauphoetae]|uniref:Tetratricopeptide repeat protein n=1 Tax=Blattamonas nauphoetae TaxID=2049346 RepID=A0ABQ9Y4V2_9EUKA|nr:hypothetical protein BLNAU_6269 [Blattamonas nauphoetae]
MEVSTSFDPLDRTTPPDAIAVMMRRLGITWNSPLTTLMYSTRPAKNFEQLAQQQAGLFAKHTVLEECKKLGIDLLHLPPQSLFLQSKMKEDLHASFNTFSSCFKYDSQCQAAIIALGHLYYHLGQYEDSLRQFEKALQYEKDSTSEDRITILTFNLN